MIIKVVDAREEVCEEDDHEAENIEEEECVEDYETEYYY